MLARRRVRTHTRCVPPLAIAAAISSAIIHASWNAALKGGRGDRIADAFLIAIGGILVAALLFVTMGVPNQASWPYLAISVFIHLIYWVLLFKAYDMGDLSHIYTLSRGTAPLLVTLGAMIAAQEIPPPIKAVGMVLVSLGVLCVGFSPNAPLRASLWALVLGVSIASYSLVDALGARLSGNAVLYVGWTSGLMGVPMIAFCAWRALARHVHRRRELCRLRLGALGADFRADRASDGAARDVGGVGGADRFCGFARAAWSQALAWRGDRRAWRWPDRVRLS